MVELGQELLAIKKKLPRGHFQSWIEEKSGISYTDARRFMKAAKEADQQERSAARRSVGAIESTVFTARFKKDVTTKTRRFPVLCHLPCYSGLRRERAPFLEKLG